MKLATAFLISALVQGESMAQNMIVNGSFESPSATTGYLNFQQLETIDGAWVVESATLASAVLNSYYTGGGVLWPNPIAGTQFLYIGNAATAARIAQTFTITATGVHHLSFQLSDFSSPFANPGWVAGAIVLVDIVNVTSAESIIGGPKTFQTGALSGFGTYSLNFSPTAVGAHKITFTSVLNHASILDDVQIVSVSTEGLNVEAKASSAVAVEWPSVAGKNYRILYSEDMVSWFPQDDVFPGTGQLLRYFDKLDTSRKFYRVIEISQ